MTLEDGREIFFHINDYRAPDNSDAEASNAPRQHHRVVCKVGPGKKGPRATVWCFRHEYDAKVKRDNARVIKARRLPSIHQKHLTDEDVCVGSYDGHSNANMVELVRSSVEA